MMLVRLNLPHLLHAQPKRLVLTVGPQLVLGEQSLGQRASAALAKNSLLRPQFQPPYNTVTPLTLPQPLQPLPRKTVLHVTALADAHVVGGNANHVVVLIVQHLSATRY